MRIQADAEKLCMREAPLEQQASGVAAARDTQAAQQAAAMAASPTMIPAARFERVAQVFRDRLVLAHREQECNSGAQVSGVVKDTQVSAPSS